jgi:hypothetical protein
VLAEWLRTKGFLASAASADMEISEHVAQERSAQAKLNADRRNARSRKGQ